MQVFFCFALVTNLIVSALLVLGGSAVITAVTGMNVYAASMLIPISVLLYTASGGLKATFTTSYAHTVIIYVALCLFTFTVYAGAKNLGIGSINSVSCHRSALQCPACFMPAANQGYVCDVLERYLYLPAEHTLEHHACGASLASESKSITFLWSCECGGRGQSCSCIHVSNCLQVWEHLSVMAKRRPIAGNKGGSALTMFSSSGLVFGVLQVSPTFAHCTYSPHIFRSHTSSCQLGPAGEHFVPYKHVQN